MRCPKCGDLMLREDDEMFCLNGHRQTAPTMSPTYKWGGACPPCHFKKGRCQSCGKVRERAAV